MRLKSDEVLNASASTTGTRTTLGTFESSVLAPLTTSSMVDELVAMNARSQTILSALAMFRVNSFGTAPETYCACSRVGVDCSLTPRVRSSVYERRTMLVPISFFRTRPL